MGIKKAVPKPTKARHRDSDTAIGLQDDYTSFCAGWQQRKERKMDVFEKIISQQEKLLGTDAWMVGEQLKDICRAEPACADLVSADLENEGMGLTAAAKQIRAWADKQPRKGNCVVVQPQVAEQIIRKFYGLPEAGAEQGKQEAAAQNAGILDLSAFL